VACRTPTTTTGSAANANRLPHCPRDDAHGPPKRADTRFSPASAAARAAATRPPAWHNHSRPNPALDPPGEDRGTLPAEWGDDPATASPLDPRTQYHPPHEQSTASTANTDSPTIVPPTLMRTQRKNRKKLTKNEAASESEPHGDWGEQPPTDTPEPAPWPPTHLRKQPLYPPERPTPACAQHGSTKNTTEATAGLTSGTTAGTTTAGAAAGTEQNHPKPPNWSTMTKTQRRNWMKHQKKK